MNFPSIRLYDSPPTKPGVRKIAGTRLYKNPDGTIHYSGPPIQPMPDEQLSPDTCLSYNEWKQCGYYVRKGSKSYFRDALGEPQFTIEQVAKRRS